YRVSRIGHTCCNGCKFTAATHGRCPPSVMPYCEPCLEMSMPAKILVVDNRRSLRHSVCSLLADQSDWDVYEAESGKVALDRIQEVKPDVVVLAVMMTEMNGLEAAGKIRQLAPETRVIFMSSQYSP